MILMCVDSFALQWPTPDSTITSGYGWRIHPSKSIVDSDSNFQPISIGIEPPIVFLNQPKWHNGIDIRANYEQLKAVESGKIDNIASDVEYGGNRVKAGSWNYLHLSDKQSEDWAFAEDKKGFRYFAIQVNGVKKYYSNETNILEIQSNLTTTATLTVSAYQNISEGDVFAISGTAGTGPHLHLIQNGGDPTKSPLIALYSATNGTGYNPPLNSNDPIVSDLAYDNVTGIVAGKTDATTERDINKFMLSFTKRQDRGRCFYPCFCCISN